MIIPTQNKHLAEEYYNKLPADDINRRYYEEGLTHDKPEGTWARIRAAADIPNKLHQLKGFYPYHRIIKATEEQYYVDWQSAIRTDLAFTAVAWTCLFSAGRHGYVLPVLREYGSFFGTHRLFRHYLYTLALPLLYSDWTIANTYLDHVETLWTIHANRLNQKLLDDPSGTIYPNEHRDKLRRSYFL